MDRNQIIGFILIFATLLAWNMLNAPSKEELAKSQRIKDSLALVSVQDTFQEAAPQTLISIDTAGVVAGDTNRVEAQVVSLENEVVKIDFNTKGGKIVGATLKNYQRSNDKNYDEKVKLAGDPRNRFDFIFPVGNANINTESLFFTPKITGNKLEMVATMPSGKAITQTYELKGDYKVDFSLAHSEVMSATPTLVWNEILPKLEKSTLYEQNYSTVYYKESEEGSADYCNCTSSDLDDLAGKQLDWLSHSNQFFNISLMANNFKFKGGKFETVMTDIKNTEDLKSLKSTVELPQDVKRYDMSMYVGPNVFENLKAYDNGLEQIIPFGSSIFGTINRYIVRPSFDFLSGFISSKGIVIILLIFIIKMLLYPLLYKMLHSQAKMAALKPELAVLKTKYKDDLQKQQMESMKVYQEFGVSPLSGCLPMLMQMPIWIALYRFFPASITFRREPFLWADDLSSYDSFFKLGFEIPFFGAHISLFTLLWAISTVIYTYYSTKDVDMSANPAMKYVQYFMPIMFLGFFNSYASGLTCYMFFSNLINILQIIFTKKFIFDDEKIRKELEVQKLKPKKVGGFQSRLQDALKQQQEITAQKAKQKK
ncbi:MAG TPA: membrane protein insertase YidC [Saprospiraceae bacterium]|nr:membrane protein insertase YidC [Saprospiraceae bacterium]